MPNTKLYFAEISKEDKDETEIEKFDCLGNMLRYFYELGKE